MVTREVGSAYFKCEVPLKNFEEHPKKRPDSQENNNAMESLLLCGPDFISIKDLLS